MRMNNVDYNFLNHDSGLDETVEYEAIKPFCSFMLRGQILKQMVKLVESVEGEIVEFGVASGASTRVIRNSQIRNELIQFAKVILCKLHVRKKIQLR